MGWIAVAITIAKMGSQPILDHNGNHNHNRNRVINCRCVWILKGEIYQDIQKKINHVFTLFAYAVTIWSFWQIIQLQNACLYFRQLWCTRSQILPKSHKVPLHCADVHSFSSAGPTQLLALLAPPTGCTGKVYLWSFTGARVKSSSKPQSGSGSSSEWEHIFRIILIFG